MHLKWFQAFSRQQYHHGSELRVLFPLSCWFPIATCWNIAHNLDLQPSARSRTQWIAFARPWKKHDAEQLADEPTSGRGTGIWPRICSRGVELFFLVVGSITGPMFYQKNIICTACEVCFYCFLSEIFLLHHLDQTNSSSLNIVPIRNQHASSSW